MKRALVALIAGTVLSGLAAAYASTDFMLTKNGAQKDAAKSDLATAKTRAVASSD